MSDLTQLLSDIEAGDPLAAGRLLPLVYEELRKLAASKLARMGPAQTLQPTALVHEAYLRLVDTDRVQSWSGRGHFFVAAAEAMQRILVEHHRRKACLKRGGHLRLLSLEQVDAAAPEDSEDLLALDEALKRLDVRNPPAAKLVKLRYFTGLSIDQAADVLDISPRTAKRVWAYAKVWLLSEIRESG